MYLCLCMLIYVYLFYAEAPSTGRRTLSAIAGSKRNFPETSKATPPRSEEPLIRGLYIEALLGILVNDTGALLGILWDPCKLSRGSMGSLQGAYYKSSMGALLISQGFSVKETRYRKIYRRL